MWFIKFMRFIRSIRVGAHSSFRLLHHEWWGADRARNRYAQALAGEEIPFIKSDMIERVLFTGPALSEVEAQF